MKWTPAPSGSRPRRDSRASYKADPAERASVIDQHVGARIRERRTQMGVSQQQLARAVGVTYQQAHKYEHGVNRS